MSYYICIEGTDGTGTTTVTRELYKWFCTKQISTVQLHEPHDLDETGPLIRKWLAATDLTTKERKALCHLFVANRISHMDTVANLLSAGYVVLSDRCFVSTLVYQSEVYSQEYLQTVHGEDSLVRPNLILLLHGDWDPQRQAQRISARNKQQEFFEQLPQRHAAWLRYQHFSQAGHALGVPIYTIDAWKPLTEVLSSCKNIIKGVSVTAI